MQNKITYVRSSNGSFVKATVTATKKVYEVTADVLSTYAALINALLTLALKVGLFCFLYPYIARFILYFINTVAVSMNDWMM